MRGWLRGGYIAILFESGAEVIGYALFTDQEYGGIHLRQFFVASAHRRRARRFPSSRS
jgi:acyl-coenzyme A thioesterase PaaI-like protein